MELESDSGNLDLNDSAYNTSTVWSPISLFLKKNPFFLLYDFYSRDDFKKKEDVRVSVA